MLPNDSPPDNNVAFSFEHHSTIFYLIIINTIRTGYTSSEEFHDSQKQFQSLLSLYI